jgi:hypothetical protein
VILTDEKLTLERIGMALALRRRMQGLTTHEASHIAEIGETTWRYVEHGRGVLRFETFTRMCKVLDIDSALLTGVLEHLLLDGYHKDDIKALKLNPEKAGRPKKGAKGVRHADLG